MQLIIRVTGKCNFDCSFCSAEGLNIGHPVHGVPDQIKEVIQKIKPTSIIISGGEPLMVDPGYYLELLKLAKCHISITSNLKDFCYHPEKWRDLLRMPEIGLITSFNYGDTRKWNRDTPYTEDMFRRITDLYHKEIERPLPFIAVIDESNEQFAVDHARLAKELGTVVRLNNATKQGRQQTTYPRYKMFQHYLDIIDAGLGNYEFTTKDRRFDQCPWNCGLLCHAAIRTCYVDLWGNLHYYNCCENDTMDEELDLANDHPEIAPEYPPIEKHVNANCVFCPMYKLCNGCRSQRLEYPPEHCAEMQKLKPRFEEQGWLEEIK